MAEIIAHQTRLSAPPQNGRLTIADRVVAFPDRPGIETVAAGGLDTILPPLIDRAVRNGELPVGVDRDAVLLGLSTIFFGLPVFSRRIDPSALGPTYLRLVGIFWEGLQSFKGGKNK